MHSCEKCEKIFKTKNELTRHLKRKYPCVKTEEHEKLKGEISKVKDKLFAEYIKSSNEENDKGVSMLKDMIKEIVKEEIEKTK